MVGAILVFVEDENLRRVRSCEAGRAKGTWNCLDISVCVGCPLYSRMRGGRGCRLKLDDSPVRPDDRGEQLLLPPEDEFTKGALKEMTRKAEELGLTLELQYCP